MYVITGITGKVGGTIGCTLHAAGLPVRAVVRNLEKGRVLAAQGYDVAMAEIDDARALTKAFHGAEAIFIMLPPNYDPVPEFAEAKALSSVLYESLMQAKPKRVVCLSTIGAHAEEENLLHHLRIMEQKLQDLPMPVAFLRPGWFMENSLWDIGPAKTMGIVPSFLQPLDKPVPMVATADVGRVAAELLQQTWTGVKKIELEGPVRISPIEVASMLSDILGKPVRMESVPRQSWDGLFRSQGAKNPQPRIRMLDGFNEGWIDFEGNDVRKGTISMQTVLEELVAGCA
jgi:uncharacterized protein YbjT (DUF2867 family)